MGRPLRRETIVKMGLEASGKKLGKQVGFNKYLVQESEEVDTEEVVRLAEEVVADNDVILTINGKKVLKVLRNIIQTSDEVIAYTTNENGEMVIDGAVAEIGGEEVEETPAEPEVEPEQPSEETEETPVEPEEEVEETPAE